MSRKFVLTLDNINQNGLNENNLNEIEMVSAKLSNTSALILYLKFIRWIKSHNKDLFMSLEKNTVKYKYKPYARIVKAHSHSMSGGSIWASLERQCCFWIAGGLVSYCNMWLLILQLFKNSNDTQEKLRLNHHSLSASELLKYGR
jgi:sensor c-di-GMP phosphodiesterase-like protein